MDHISGKHRRRKQLPALVKTEKILQNRRLLTTLIQVPIGIIYKAKQKAKLYAETLGKHFCINTYLEDDDWKEQVENTYNRIVNQINDRKLKPTEITKNSNRHVEDKIKKGTM